MTHKKTFYILTLLFILSACQTGRRAQHDSSFVPDVPTKHNVATTPTLPQTTTLTPSARTNINKVEKAWPGSWQGQLQGALDSLANIELFETTQLGMCIFDLTDDKMLYAINANQRLRPASNQKLLTAITALDGLGADYRFIPTVLKPGWGWCWDDSETGMTEFQANGKRRNADTLYCEKREWTLQEVLLPMMKKSDNLLAESVFWQLGGKADLSTASRKECVERIKEVIDKTPHTATDYVIADGSGLSLYDYVSPHLLTMMLRYAYQTPSIFSTLYPSLPIAGVDGTLEKRMKGTRAEANVHAKTGTVTGVSSLAGYCTHPSGHVLAFCIINQGVSKSSIGRNYQDEICKKLCGEIK